MQCLGKQLAERGGLRAMCRHRKIESRELEGLFGAIAVVPPRFVVPAPPFDVAQRFVGLGDPLTRGSRGAVPPAASRAIPPRQPSIRPRDIRDARVRRETEDGVVVHGATGAARCCKVLQGAEGGSGYVSAPRTPQHPSAPAAPWSTLFLLFFHHFRVDHVA